METIQGMQNTFIFTKVAQNGSFTEAGKQLGVSKAYISKAVQNLENELGKRLLNRTTRQVKLTFYGEQFFEICEKNYQNILREKELIISTSTTPKGPLKISLAGAFGEKFILPLVLEFVNLYPEVKIELDFTERIIDLVAENYDLAIRVGKMSDSSLIAKRIATRKEFICATPKYLKSIGPIDLPEDLIKYNIIAGRDFWPFIINEKKKNIKIRPYFKTNNGQAMLKATLSNLGISRLPEVYVKSYIESGDLIPILSKFMPEDVPIWAVTPSKKNVSEALKQFLIFLSQNLPKSNC